LIKYTKVKKNTPPRELIHRLIILLLITSPLLTLGQEVSPKNMNPGWALHLGAGHLYGGNLGLLAERQFLLKPKCRISPFVSNGLAEGGKDFKNQRYFWYGFSTGCLMELGQKHRIIFGPHFVMQTLVGKNIAAEKSQLPGASFVLGYKITTDKGWIFQVYLGNLYSQDDDAFSSDLSYSHRSHGGIGLGYKW